MLDPALSGVQPWRRYRRAILSAVPAALASPTITVPAGHLYTVKSVMATLVNGVGVPDRYPILVINDGHADVLKVPSGYAGPASLSWTYVWAFQGPHGAGVTTYIDPLPDLTLPDGWTLRIDTTNITGTDQWGAMTLVALDTEYRDRDLYLSGVPDQTVSIAGGLNVDTE